jgi:hypothetical protein
MAFGRKAFRIHEGDLVSTGHGQMRKYERDSKGHSIPKEQAKGPFNGWFTDFS